jgi:hypothetical protein
METSWTCSEEKGRLKIAHDNRWLAIIGVPIALVGVAIAVGPWFLEGVSILDAWPILAVGSLIGSGFILMGLALSFKYDEVIADRDQDMLIQNTGLPPFRRSKTWPLKAIEEVVCLNEQMGRASGSGASFHCRLRLLGPKVSVLLASDLEAAPIRFEAERWAYYLNLPIKDKLGEDLKAKLHERARKLNHPT